MHKVRTTLYGSGTLRAYFKPADMKYDAQDQRIITPDQLQRLEELLGVFKGIFNIISKTYSYAPISSTIDPLIEDFDSLVTEIEQTHPKGSSTRDSF